MTIKLDISFNIVTLWQSCMTSGYNVLFTVTRSMGSNRLGTHLKTEAEMASKA